VLKEKFGVPFEYKFKPYYYGPYSRDLADSLSLLEGTNLVTERIENLRGGIVRHNFELTERGKEITEKISSKIENRKFLKELEGKIEEIEQIPTPELIMLSKKICTVS
jgi:uncharacterized protein YwgA